VVNQKQKHSESTVNSQKQTKRKFMGKISPLFARQPIFDTELKVVAYEFLFILLNNF